MSAVRGKVTVVTGAGSGIGRQLALALAARGARVAVSDVNAAGLAETVSQLKAAGASDVQEAVLDVSDRQAVLDYAAAVAGHFGVVHQVYNNAGVGTGGTVLDSEWEVYDLVLGVNLMGVINGTKAFLPYLIASGDGHVINISSLNGYFAQPTLSAYAASKFGVRGFTETLRTEMLHGRYPVRTTVVHPGGVKTNVASANADLAREAGVELTPEQLKRMRIYNEKLLKMPADQAAGIIVDGVEAGRPRVLVGSDARLLDAIVRLLPGTYPKLSAYLERVIFGR